MISVGRRRHDLDVRKKMLSTESPADAKTFVTREKRSGNGKLREKEHLDKVWLTKEDMDAGRIEEATARTDEHI